MPLRAWLSERLSPFWQWMWLGRAPLHEGVAAVARGRPGRDYVKKARRLDLELCEPRETPDDLFGILQSGVALGGLPLLTADVPTPPGCC